MSSKCIFIFSNAFYIISATSRWYLRATKDFAKKRVTEITSNKHEEDESKTTSKDV